MTNWARRGLGQAIRRSRDEAGQALVEYALLISLIAVASFGILEILGVQLSSLYSSTVHQLFP